MKNASKLLLIAGSTLLLAGCGAVDTTVPEGSTPLMTIGNTTITKNDEYQLIKRASGPSLTLSDVQQMIYDQEVGRGDDITKEAETTYESYASSSENFEEQLKNYGYADKQDYMDTVLIPNVQSSKLQEIYVKEAQDDIESTYHPVLCSIIATDSEDNANKALQALKDGEDAGKVGAQYASEGAQYNGGEQIITSLDTTLPVKLLNTLAESEQTGVLDEVFSTDTSTDNKTYYVVDVVSRDYSANESKIAEALKSNTDFQTSCTVFYLKKYDFEVHDQYIFDYLKATNPNMLVSRPDLAVDSSSTN